LRIIASSGQPTAAATIAPNNPRMQREKMRQIQSVHRGPVNCVSPEHQRLRATMSIM
jgi:hypothetical protein